MENFSGEIAVSNTLFLKRADEGFLRLTGLSMNSFAKDAFCENDVEIIKNAPKALENGMSFSVVRVRRADGTLFPALAEFSIIEDEEFLMSIKLNEISGLLQAKSEAEDEKDAAQTYLALAQEIMLEYRPDADILKIYYFSNSARCELFNGTISEFRNGGVKIDRRSERSFGLLCGDIMSAKRDFSHIVVINGLLGGSEPDACVFRCHAINDNYIIGIIKVENEERFKSMIIDPVNDKDVFLDMLNKRAFNEHADRIIKRSKNCFVVLFDLDNFKHVNDTYGHSAGDEVLVTVTQIINKTLAGRGIVGRLGGDEIALVTETIAEQTELRNMLRSIRTTVEWKFKNDPRKLNVTCSMGVSSYPENGKDLSLLLSIADKMLYLAKSKGKNRYIIYTPEIHDPQLYPEKTPAEKESVSDEKLDNVEIMQRLVENYLIKRSYNNEKMFSEIGRSFGLSEILMIYEDFTVAFQWTPRGAFSNIDKIVYFKPDEDFGDLFAKNKLLILDALYKFEGRAPNVQKCLEEKKINSAIFYKIIRKNRFSGYVMFGKETQRTSWSQLEIMALSTAAKAFELYTGDDGIME